METRYDAYPQRWDWNSNGGEYVANGTCQNDRSGTSFSGSFSGTTEAGHSPSVAGQVVPAVRFYIPDGAAIV